MLKEELIEELQLEHEELYQDLDMFMLDLSSVKQRANHKHLDSTCSKLLVFIKELLDNHFLKEENELFPQLESVDNEDLLSRLIADHKEIEEKYSNLIKYYDEFKKRLANNYFNDYDYKTALLFPAYNLVATINHHAAREDSFFLKSGAKKPQGKSNNLLHSRH